VLGRGTELSRPSILATLLWALGVFVIGLTVYSLIFWGGGLTTLDLHDSLLIFVAFSSGINAIATGALIDMHTMRYKKARAVEMSPAKPFLFIIVTFDLVYRSCSDSIIFCIARAA